MSVLDPVRRLGPHARRAGVIALGVLAAGVVTSLSVDVGKLAPTLTFGRVDLRRSAETFASRQLKRQVHVGALTVRLFDGRFVLTDVVIEGLTASDDPFLKAREIAFNVPPWSLLRQRLDIASVEATDWQVKIEAWTGRSNLPALPKRTSTGPSPIETLVSYLRARRGQFTYVDHVTPWSAVIRNLDITVLKLAGYRGYSTASGGTITVQSYTPMSADLRTWFRIEGAVVRFERIELDTDGMTGKLTGAVDLAHWPEQTYQIDSVIQMAPQRAIWWAPNHFTFSGDATFKGTLHLFKGGRILAGNFRSEEFGIDWYRFPRTEGSVVWTAERLDIMHARSGFYGGEMNLTYSMAPLNRAGVPPSMRLDTAYADVDLGAFSDAMEMKGLRLSGRATGRNLLEWRSGHWDEHRGGGEIALAPPAGVAVQGPERSVTRAGPSFAHVFGDPFPPLGRVPIGGVLQYTYGPEWVDIERSRIASHDVHRIRRADRVRRPLARAVPRHEHRLAAERPGTCRGHHRLRIADTPGGAGRRRDLRRRAVQRVLEPSHRGAAQGDARELLGRRLGHRGEPRRHREPVRGRRRRGGPQGRGHAPRQGPLRPRLPAQGPRRGDERRVPGRRLGPRGPPSRVRARQAPVRGPGVRRTPSVGPVSRALRLRAGTVAPVSAYEETATSASASLRFDGPGVWLDGIDIRKGATGIIRGAAHLEWLGSYSFNADAQNIPVESIDMVAFPEAPLTGRLDFTAAGSGDYLHPTYDADFRVRDLYVKDEGIGDVKGRLELRGDDANFSFDGNSSRLAASGAGKVTLLGDYPGDVTLRLTDASLDPYARVFMPGLSPFATAVASGTVRISGTLLSLDNIVAKVQVDALAVKLFDYGLQNEGALDASLEQGVLRIGRFTLSGENTRLSLNGNVDVLQGILALRAEGAANLGILQAFTPDIRGSGRAEVTADVTGTFEQPQIGGSAVITDGRLRHMWLPHAIEHIDGRVVFAGSSLRFDDVTAKIGGGDVRFGGRIGLAGLWPSQFEITATGENMELRYPEGFRSIVDADLGLRGTLEDPVLSGTVLVRRAEMRQALDLGSGIADFSGSAGGGAASAAAPPAAAAFPLRFDVRLSAPSTIEIDNKQARLTASADLRLRGTFQKPIIEGRAEVQRGEIWFEGKRYVVTRGTIDFSNPAKIEPYFDVEAETRVRAPGQTYRVTFRAAGTGPKKLAIELSSDPPLPEVDILSLLLGDAGSSTQDAELRSLKTPDAAEQNLLVSRSARLLTGRISTNVQNAVEQTFGLDSVQITPFFIDPSQQAGRFSPGARLTIGKRISDRVYLTYSRSLASAARDQVILLEYDQSDRLAWIVTQNEDRTYALDVRVRHVFR